MIGIPGVKRYCLFLDSTEQAMAIRKLLLNRFLRYASHEQHDERIQVAIAAPAPPARKWPPKCTMPSISCAATATRSTPRCST
jgi:hypothetical protein